MRIDPPISEPIPNGDPAAACIQPSPPEEPPTICLKVDNDEIRSCRIKSCYDFCHLNLSYEEIVIYTLTHL